MRNSEFGIPAHPLPSPCPTTEPVKLEVGTATLGLKDATKCHSERGACGADEEPVGAERSAVPCRGTCC
jgi:hypothetical protein